MSLSIAKGTTLALFAAVALVCIAIAAFLLVGGSEPSKQSAESGRAIIFVPAPDGAVHSVAERKAQLGSATGDRKAAIVVAARPPDPAVEATLNRYLKQDIVASRQRALERRVRMAPAAEAMAEPPPTATR